MRKKLFLIGAACLALGPVANDSMAYLVDQELKLENTPQCKSFSEMEAPEFTVIPRRYKHEDKTLFYKLRQDCEMSLTKQ